MNITDYKDIAVFIEQRKGEIQPVSLELLSKARQLADTSEQKVIAVLLGDNIKSHIDTLIGHGADSVLFADSPELKTYQTEPYLQAMVQIFTDINPNIVLIGSTSIGRDLAPRLSVKFQTGLTADCIQLEMKTEDDSSDISKNKDLLMTRPTLGGNLISTIVCPDHRPQLATVRPSVMQQTPIDTSRNGTNKEYTIEFNTKKFQTEILEEVITTPTSSEKSIEQHNLILAGGRGLKNKDQFNQLVELSQQLHAGIAASRGITDLGWASHDILIGQTGKTVRPELYIAFGISGAIQHTTGMENSKYIIAINNDKNAPIFKIADLGIICDIEPVISGLKETTKKQ